jgi:Holliday junction resolvase-like predicted endonuclease
MIDLEKIKAKLLNGKKIEDVLEKFNWKEFEEVIAEIFRKNNFRTKQNFRFKTKRRFEIDLIALKRNLVFCVDCKEWSKGRYKKTGLRYAVKNQKERTEELKKFIKNNPIAQSSLKIDEKHEFHPLIVTLLEEDLVEENNVFIVPVWKLNNFLIEI